MSRPIALGRRLLRPGTAIILAIILFLALNLIGELKFGSARIDLTERSLYTLSEGTRKVIGSLTEPVSIRLYRTQQLLDSVPSLQTYSVQILQLLRTFEEVSDGKIELQIIDTLPFSVEEDQAIGYGLAGFNLNRSGERGYYGLVGSNSLDTLETVPFLDPARQSFLQYDLTRLVYRLSRPTETRVAIMDGLGMYGSMSAGRRPWAILDILSQDFGLQQLPPDADAIPQDIDVLVVAHPAQLTPTQQFAIDQYVLNGGAALVFIDPLAENSPPDMQNRNRPRNPSSDLSPLLAAWGLQMDPGKVVGDSNMALETVGVAGQQRVVADFLPWLRVNSSALNADEPLTARLEVLRLSSAGSIKPVPGATTSLTPLIESTEASMLFDSEEIMQRPNPNVLLDRFSPSGERQTMAVRVAGPAGTAFPEGKPAGDENSPTLPGKETLTRSQGPINVIVVADSDMLADSHVIGNDGRVTTSNADFVLNAIGDLAGGDALIDVRGGGEISRPFTTVEEMRSKAESSFRATEQRLSQELADIQQRLLQLQGPAGSEGANALALSQEQQAEASRFNQRIAELRTQLREVRHALRADIEELDRRLKLINIALVPIVLIVGMGLLSLWRSARLRRYMRRQQRASMANA